MRRFRADPADDLDARIVKSASLLGYLTDHGLTGWGWPVRCGGRGGTEVQRAVLYDSITRHGYAMPESVASLEVLGCALVEFAPDLAAEQLPPMLAGRTLWCQGFSEPEAGSDLASLRTTAKPVSGGWAVTGQKVWTSLGHRADWCGLLARTGTPESRHRGLTLFWMDMHAEGVTARPLRALTGEDDFAEVFLDEVFIPAGRVVGEVGQGWNVAMYLLQYERGMWAWQRQSILHAMLQHALQGLDQPDRHAEAIARAYSALSAVRLRSLATVQRLARGERLGPEVSVDKLLLGKAEHIVNDVIRSLTPRFETSDTAAVQALRREWFYSRAATVYGGAADIQRNVIAERVLGLPRKASND
jgi:acyl-CoA dehydrogenase